MFSIESRDIGIKEKPFIIAEMSGNHNGSIDRAIALVDAAAEAGAEERSIMSMTGHKSTEMVRRYIKEANLFKNNALNKIKF